MIAVCDTPIRRPEAVISRFVEAWNRRDADVLAALFDSDAEFVNVTGLWCHTRGEIREGSRLGVTGSFASRTAQPFADALATTLNGMSARSNRWFSVTASSWS